MDTILETHIDSDFSVCNSVDSRRGFDSSESCNSFGLSPLHNDLSVQSSSLVPSSTNLFGVAPEILFSGSAALREYLSTTFGSNGKFSSIDFVDLTENVMLLLSELTRCETPRHVFEAFYKSYKLACPGNKNLTSLIWDSVIAIYAIWDPEFKVQSFRDSVLRPLTALKEIVSGLKKIDFEPALTGLRDFIAGAKNAESNSLLTKLSDTFQYLACFTVLRSLLGEEVISAVTYNSRLTKYAKMLKYTPLIFGWKFFVSLLELFEDILTRGIAYLKTGEASALLYDSTEVTKWVENVNERLLYSERVLCGEDGCDPFALRLDILALLDTGLSFQKGLHALSKIEKKCLISKLHDLRMVCNKLDNRRLAGQLRPLPFAIFFYGGTSVGKTDLTKLLFKIYAECSTRLGKPLVAKDEFLYSRNPNDEYWSGYENYHWAIRCDDISQNIFVKGEVDKSTDELISLINICPLLTNQAELEKKGNVRAQPSLVMLNTNKAHLDIHVRKHCPGAFWRRMKMRFRVDVKPKFQSALGTLDSSKVTEERNRLGAMPFPWIITMERMHLMSDDRQSVIWEPFLSIFGFEGLYMYVFNQLKTHFDDMRAIEESTHTYHNMEMCFDCRSLSCSTPNKCRDDFPEQLAVQSLPLRNDWWFARAYTFLRTHGPVYILSLIMFLLLTSVYFLLSFFFWGLMLVLGTPSYYFRHFLRKCKYRILAWKFGLDKFVIVRLAQRVRIHIFGWRLAFALTSIVAALAALRSAYKKWHRGYRVLVQGQYVAKPTPAPEAEKNVYYNADTDIANCEMDRKSISMASLSVQRIGDQFSKNVAFMRLHVKSGGTIDGQAIALCGQIWITNEHYFREEISHIEIIKNSKAGLVYGKKAPFSYRQFTRLPEKDLALFVLPDLPPARDIRPYLVPKGIKGPLTAQMITRGTDMSYVVRQIGGSYLRTIDLADNGMHGSYEMWFGNLIDPNPTSQGHCGSLVWTKSAGGVFIIGMHTALGKRNEMVSTPLFKEDVDILVSKFDSMFTIQGGVLDALYFGDISIEPTVHIKHPIRYISSGNVVVHGSLAGVSNFPGKSKVARTLLSEAIVEASKATAMPIHDKFGAPQMRGYRVKYAPLVDMVNTNSNITIEDIDDAVDSYVSDVLNMLPESELALVRDIFPVDVALNGEAGVEYIDRIKIKTSAGFPYNETKLKHISIGPSSDRWSEPIILNNEIEFARRECEEALLRGESTHPVFTAHLKDEPLPIRKVEAHKTRVFCGAPFHWSIVVRQYLLSFIRVVQRNRYVFETGVGIAAQTPQWDELYQVLISLGPNGSDGDYAKYDKTMASRVILGAFRCVVKILERAGASPEHIRVVEGIAQDVAFPTVNYFGVLLTFLGTNPSGHPLTVIINGIVNSLYTRIAYKHSHPQGHCRDFKENVSFISYGDDNIMGFRSSCDFFDHIKMSESLAKFGVIYTMADKEAKAVPRHPIVDSTFLKRGFRYDCDLGRVVAPLDHDSICKTLTWCSHTRIYDPEQHMLSVFRTAMEEYFLYGREVFEERRTFFSRLIKESGLDKHVTLTDPLPTYDFLKERYLSALEVQCGPIIKRTKTFLERVADLEEFIRNEEISPSTFLRMLEKLEELRELSPENSFSVQSGVNLPYRLLYMFIQYDIAIHEAEVELKQIQARAHLTPREILVQQYIDAWDTYEDCLVDMRAHVEFVRSYLLTQVDRFTQGELNSLL